MEVEWRLSAHGAGVLVLLVPVADTTSRMGRTARAPIGQVVQLLCRCECAPGCVCWVVHAMHCNCSWWWWWCGVAPGHCWCPPPASTCALQAACYWQGVNIRQRV